MTNECTKTTIIHDMKAIPHPVSSVNNWLYYDFSISLTKIEKQSSLIN